MFISKNLTVTMFATLLATQSFAGQPVIQKKDDTLSVKTNEQKQQLHLKVVFDKIALVNSEDEFEKNIPIEQMNILIKSYLDSLNLLENAVNPNKIVLSINFQPKTDKNKIKPFKMETGTPTLDIEQAAYQKVYDSLAKIKMPDVKNNLQVIIYSHTQLR